MLPRLLTVAGSDSSGGAGLQADLKTFLALGGYGMSVVTAVTAQDTRGVLAIEALPPAFVALELGAVLEDVGVDAVKCGMLYGREHVEVVARALAPLGVPVVVDPVLAASGGTPLLRADGIEALRRTLFPVATVLTPNIPEARTLAGLPESAGDDEVAQRLLGMGARYVLLKGGHRPGDEVVDRLYGPDVRETFRHPRRPTPHTHGTGCTLSAALAFHLAEGKPVPEATALAIRFVDGAIAHSLPLGRGRGVPEGAVPVGCAGGTDRRRGLRLARRHDPAPVRSGRRPRASRRGAPGHGG
jgi:hydroxymethylpyrimidine/phosphomethylpyrimidine kinase